MSKEACTFCGTIVHTTHDPNKYEGFFVSLVEVEKLEMVPYHMTWPDGHQPSFSLRYYLQRNCRSLVVCDACRESKLYPSHREQGAKEKP